MTTTADHLLRDLGRSDVLDLAVSSRRNADREEAQLLAAAVHWVDLHPVAEDELPLAGQGTPGIAEYAVEELAAALDLSHAAGLALVVEAVELCFRLPRLWAQVQDGRLQAWKARQVARATTQLSRESVAFVDRQLAVTGRRNRIPALNPVVHEARLQCDPDQALAVEQSALERRGVWLDHRESTATTLVTARLDTLDALDLDGSVSDLASTIGRLGDTRPLDVRRATALGMLAHPQRVLDLGGDANAGTPSGPNGSRGTLYLHVDATHLEDPSRAGGTVERLGSATLDLLREWVRRFSGVTVRPVLDLGRAAAVDGHDAPVWMRETVILRDGHCVFPGCGIDARSCDLDHIAPYVPVDEGGASGQTSPANLACLCRRHHRLKTFAGWAYRRIPDDPANGGSTTYAWTSPLQRSYVSR